MLLNILIAIKIPKRGRSEFVYRKAHLIEGGTGILFVGFDTLLIGYAIFGSLNKQLSGTLDANHREEAEGNVKTLAVEIVSADRSVDTAGDLVGNIVNTATTALLFVAYLDRKGDGIDDFADDGGRVGCDLSVVGGNAAEIIVAGITAENTYVSFASVKDYAFFGNGDPLKFLRSSGRNAAFKGDLGIKAQMYLIKSSVERHGIDVDTAPQNLGTLYAYG